MTTEDSVEALHKEHREARLRELLEGAMNLYANARDLADLHTGATARAWRRHARELRHVAEDLQTLIDE